MESNTGPGGAGYFKDGSESLGGEDVKEREIRSSVEGWGQFLWSWSVCPKKKVTPKLSLSEMHYTV